MWNFDTLKYMSYTLPYYDTEKETVIWKLNIGVECAEVALNEEPRNPEFSIHTCRVVVGGRHRRARIVERDHLPVRASAISNISIHDIS